MVIYLLYIASFPTLTYINVLPAEGKTAIFGPVLESSQIPNLFVYYDA